MLVSPVHPKKASCPMDVILSGSVILFRSVRPEKADAAMVSTGKPSMVLGIFRAVSVPV